MAPASLVESLDHVLADKEALSELRQDDIVRRRLCDAATRLSLAMESQGDSINRIRETPLQLALAKVGVDKGVFERLAEAKRQGKVLTNAELALNTGIDPVLLKRILRYWESLGTISQPGEDEYTANNVTEALASVQGRTAIVHNFDTMVPVFMVLPEYLGKHGYKPIKDIMDTPFQLGHKTKLDPWAWGQEKPERYQNFLAWMTHAREGDPMFLDAVDLGEYFRGSKPDTVLFVDVSGSRGLMAIEVRKKYAQVPGRVILQDQDYTIATAKNDPDPGFDTIETAIHDFFAGPNPIKGARVYYLRNILHDWSDAKCLEILASVKPAMSAESVLLIDEIVLPEKGAPWRAAQLDIEMLVHLAGAERTEKEWRNLLGAAGFKVKSIRKYSLDRGEGVIEATLN
ncbi:hypothetical protein KVR01_013248 [Diaporthe batatas]|uniref:uncharacterized protein n=1 Tax=Diaporthe batatas TaxID=748121 RepID=UPI001D03873D|nr:uncharacterized protein KVR01_013248 [Diaporthe batatas]KAG8156835.1 hypothetical protein KVR01_013248 [Diaporthe batatas]